MRARFSGGRTGGVSFFAFQDIITGTAGFLIVVALFLALNLDRVILTSTDADRPDAREDGLKALHERIAHLKQKVVLLQKLPAEDEQTLQLAIDHYKSVIATLEPRTPAASSAVTPGRPADRDSIIEREKAETALRDLEEIIRRTRKQLAEALQKLPELENQVKDAESSVQASRDRGNVLRLIPERTNTTKEPVLVLVEKSRLMIQTFDNALWKDVHSPADLLSALAVLPPSDHYVVFYFKPSGAGLFEGLTEIFRKAGYEIGYDVVPENIELEFAKESR
ncbi:MAG TPA: hypothetical protein VD994_02570 [Prosthecobacter sp.]|nr:hypothetical protein [Prosthecobacter sp.]